MSGRHDTQKQITALIFRLLAGSSPPIRFIAFFAAVLLLAWSAGLLADGTVSGRVMDGDTSLGVAGVPVCLFKSGESTPVVCGVSDGDGDYTTAPAPDDDYAALAVPGTDGYVREFYPGAYLFEYSGGADIITIDGADVTAIDFSLDKGFTIGGTVSQRSNGAPVIQADVCVRRTSGSLTRICSRTDNTGQYVTSGIPVEADDLAVVVDMEDSAYISQVYDDVACPGLACDFGPATAVEVGPGNATGIDFSLDLESTASIGGTVTDALGGGPVHPVAVDVIHPGTGTVIPIGVTNNPDGSWEIADLPPTGYKVLFNAYETAEIYGDELYDGVPCDNGSCDFVAEGSIIELSPGSNVLDVDLQVADPDAIRTCIHIFADGLEDGPVEFSVDAPNCIGPPLIAGILYQQYIPVQAPDGSELGFTLVSGPEGMELDAETGLLSWLPGHEFKGLNVPVHIVVSNNDSTATLRFDLRVAAGIALALDEFDGTFTVNDGSSDLDGMSFTLPPEADIEGSGFSVEIIDPSDAPTLPGDVIRLTDIFYTAQTVAAGATPISVTTPILPLPGGYAPLDLRLFVFGTGTVIGSGTWAGSTEGLSSDGAAATFEAPMTGLLSFVGVYALPDGGGSGDDFDRPQAVAEACCVPISADHWLCTPATNPSIQVDIDRFSIADWGGIEICEVTDLVGTIALQAPELGLEIPDRVHLSFQRGSLFSLPDTDAMTPKWSNSTIVFRDESILPDVARLPEGEAKSAEARRRFEGTLAHELFHVAAKWSDIPGRTNPNSVKGFFTTPYVTRGWVQEGLAEWFSDQVLDEVNHYRFQGNMYDLLGRGLGASRRPWQDGTGRVDSDLLDYVHFGLWKMVHRSCRGFLPADGTTPPEDILLRQLTHVTTGDAGPRSIGRVIEILQECAIENSVNLTPYFNLVDILSRYQSAVYKHNNLSQLDPENDEPPFSPTSCSETDCYHLIGVTPYDESDNPVPGRRDRVQFVFAPVSVPDDSENFIGFWTSTRNLRELGALSYRIPEVLSELSPRQIANLVVKVSGAAENQVITAVLEEGASKREMSFLSEGLNYVRIMGPEIDPSFLTIINLSDPVEVEVRLEIVTATCRSSRVQNNAIWKVECRNESGHVTSSESLIISNGEITSSLSVTSYPPDREDYDQTARWRIKLTNNDKATTPHVIREEPLLPTYKEKYELQADGTWLRRGVYSAVYLSDVDNRLRSAEIGELASYEDAGNFLTQRWVCNWGELTGTVNSFLYYDLLYLDGNLNRQVREISESECPTAGWGELTNDLRYRYSVIYQCVLDGYTHNNCPLAPD
jgi:hypothetical protein